MMVEYRYFKFRAINKHFIESLVTPSLYFSTPKGLNDPFDCNFNLRAAFREAMQTATGNRLGFLHSAFEHPTLLDNFGPETAIGSAGICSFSISMENTLLWSHYADQHRGVAVLYRIPEAFIYDSTNKLLGVDKVEYGPNKLVSLLKTHPSFEMNDFMNQIIAAYFTAKSPAWSYEEEARMIRGEPGLISIPGDFVEQICFGLRTEQPDIDLVRKLATAYTGCTKFCRMVRDDSHFGFTVRAL